MRPRVGTGQKWRRRHHRRRFARNRRFRPRVSTSHGAKRRRPVMPMRQQRRGGSASSLRRPSRASQRRPPRPLRNGIKPEAWRGAQAKCQQRAPQRKMSADVTLIDFGARAHKADGGISLHPSWPSHRRGSIIEISTRKSLKQVHALVSCIASPAKSLSKRISRHPAAEAGNPHAGTREKNFCRPILCSARRIRQQQPASEIVAKKKEGPLAGGE